MPCSDGGASDYRSGYAAGEDSLRQQLENMKEMLCSSCRVLEREGYDFDENPLLSKWWDKHKKEDQARLAKEIKERNEFLLAKGIAESTPVSKLSKTHKDLLKKHGFM
jgi:hypothetical protein